METRMAYCAACDRPVRVVVKEGSESWPSPEDADLGDVVCLEHGETCTGEMCPIFDVPSEQMKKNLEAFREEGEGGGA